MKMKKLTSVALAAALAIGTFGFSVPAKAVENSTDYVLTIPAELNVANAGWNETDGITAKVKEGDTFNTGKKLSVTATSDNSWKLTAAGVTDTVGYNLATATGTYSSEATPASWEFSAAELNEASGKNKAMGIIVEDYSNKAAGNYQDTVTFTAKVENAVTTRTVTWDSSVIGNINLFEVNESYTNSGITVEMTSMESGGFYGNRMMSGGTATFVFSSTAGNIKEIVITAERVDYFNNVWSIGSNMDTLTWSGTPASSVTLSSDPIGIRDISSIVFTIEE